MRARFATSFRPTRSAAGGLTHTHTHCGQAAERETGYAAKPVSNLVIGNIDRVCVVMVVKRTARYVYYLFIYLFPNRGKKRSKKKNLKKNISRIYSGSDTKIQGIAGTVRSFNFFESNDK